MGEATKQKPLRCSGRIEGLGPYHPPAHDPGIDLVLDANEGEVPDLDLAGIAASLGAGALRRYPIAAALERRIAARWGVPPDRVVVTNGGDDAIDRVCRATLESGRRLVTHEPTFEMIGRGARLAGAQTCAAAWDAGPFPERAVCELIDERTGLVALVTPNNPTGGVIGLDVLGRIAARAAEVGAVAMVDLAYAEFADSDPTSALLAMPNVVVIRTFSKAMGLAGIRVGYAMGSPEVADWLRTTGGPYPVSAVSLALAAAALESADARGSFVKRVREEREALSSVLREIGAEPLPSQANFVSAWIEGPEEFAGRLAARGIAIRWFAKGGSRSGMVRITLPGRAESFERLTRAIQDLGARDMGARR